LYRLLTAIHLDYVVIHQHCREWLVVERQQFGGQQSVVSELVWDEVAASALGKTVGENCPLAPME